MAQFDFNVDTIPMAQSVSTVNASVIGVGTAVVGMEKAVVQTQIETSKKICDNLDTGFYVLMKSQISQKLVAQFSKINSQVALMGQIKKGILSKRDQMHKDFLMIKKRYAKLFRELDSELSTRIRELDEPAMIMAETRKALITNSFCNTPSTVLLSEKEIQNTKQFMLNARMKTKTQKSIDALSTNVFNTETYSRKIDNMMKNKTIAQNNDLFVPVLVSKMDSLASSNSEYTQTFVSSSMSEETKKQTESFFATENFQNLITDKTENEKSLVKNEFSKFLAMDSSNERVKQTMQSLFEGCEL